MVRWGSRCLPLLRTLGGVEREGRSRPRGSPDPFAESAYAPLERRAFREATRFDPERRPLPPGSLRRNPSRNGRKAATTFTLTLAGLEAIVNVLRRCGCQTDHARALWQELLRQAAPPEVRESRERQRARDRERGSWR